MFGVDCAIQPQHCLLESDLPKKFTVILRFYMLRCILLGSDHETQSVNVARNLDGFAETLFSNGCIPSDRLCRLVGWCTAIL